ncbi:gametocyte-specific factor 1 [Trichonephila inaurata madagascariensis]|uniref:Gametocyte-specific factor 1 n=1 Tax=Trichonephila inaurata madagascariensis TaxID=2747483 RepID=A0A8X6Y584_9ARAC|nr:gametocyte-specific factor 1 [Trichonephila inaurata madagascariensis]
MNPNMMVTCPYNNAHRMKESRLQIHITKCRQDHLNDDHFVCPFNSTHVLPHQERAYHLLRCPDKAPLDRKLAESMDKNNPFKGRTAVPSYSEPIPIEPSEVWDEDEDFEPRSAIAAAKEAPVGAIMQPKPFTKPAYRRQMYQELHQMPAEVESKPTIYKAPIDSELRQPKQPSQAGRLQNLEKQGTEFQGAGLGRDKASCRIAANIFNPASESDSDTVGATAAVPGSNDAGSNSWGVGRSTANHTASSGAVPRSWASHAASNCAIPRDSSYSAAISAGINNLSLGRGRTYQSGAVSQTGFSEDDFPALGLGQGSQQKSSKTRW